MSEVPFKRISLKVDFMLKKSAERGNYYKYPIKIEDLTKMPKFTDAPIRYYVVENAYKIWRSNPENKKYSKDFYIRNFELVWKYIVDELFLTMEENVNGVRLPEQLGELYIGEPPDKDYFIMTNRPNLKYIVWRNGTKYCNKILRYFYMHTNYKRYKSAMCRDNYYKTAREKIKHIK